MATSTVTTSPPPRRFGLDEALKYWPLVVLLTAAVTNIALIKIFAAWNVMFVQLVNSSDILALGFVTGLLALFPVILALMFMPAFELLGEAVGRSRRPALILIITGLLLALTLIGKLLPDVDVGRSILSLATWLGLGLAAHVLYRVKEFNDRKCWRALLILPAVGVFLFALGLWSGMMIDLFSVKGFVGGRWAAKSDKIPCEGQIMWMGEKATIIACGGAQSRNYVVLGKDGLVLTREPPKPDAEAPAQPPALAADQAAAAANRDVK